MATALATDSNSPVLDRLGLALAVSASGDVIVAGAPETDPSFFSGRGTAVYLPHENGELVHHRRPTRAEFPLPERQQSW